MKIIIRTKKIKLTPKLRSYVDEKIGKDVAKLLVNKKPPLIARVELIRITGHHHQGMIYKVEVDLTMSGKRIIAQTQAESIEAAIDEAKDQLEREIRKTKGKEIDVSRKRGRFLKKFFHLSPLARFRRNKRK